MPRKKKSNEPNSVRSINSRGNTTHAIARQYEKEEKSYRRGLTWPRMVNQIETMCGNTFRGPDAELLQDPISCKKCERKLHEKERKGKFLG